MSGLYSRPTLATRIRLSTFRHKIPIILLIPSFILGALVSSKWFTPPPAPVVWQSDPWVTENYQPFLPPDAPPLLGSYQTSKEENADGAEKKDKTMIDWDVYNDIDFAYDTLIKDSTVEDVSVRPGYFVEQHGYLYYPPVGVLTSPTIPRAKLLQEKPKSPPITPKDTKTPPFPNYARPDAAFFFPNDLQIVPIPAKPPSRQAPKLERIQNQRVAPQRQAQLQADDGEIVYHRIGPNMAAMQKAIEEDEPFRPAPPNELKMEILDYQAEQQARRELELWELRQREAKLEREAQKGKNIEAIVQGAGGKDYQKLEEILKEEAKIELNRQRMQKQKAGGNQIKRDSDLHKRAAILDIEKEEQHDKPIKKKSSQEKQDTRDVKIDHPIPHLIDEADKKWNKMLDGQSKSLKAAVKEYKRRYKRPPPLGFDAWWKYAMERGVILVDEYDQIEDDLKPFRALSPDTLRSRSSSLLIDMDHPMHAHTFSVEMAEGKAGIIGPQVSKAIDILELMEEYASSLPDLAMTFSLKDVPGIVISGEAKQRLLDKADKGKYLDEYEAVEILENKSYMPWISLCLPNSTARRIADGFKAEKPILAGRSVISDVEEATDLCLHPNNLEINGLTAWAGPRPHLIYPLFSGSKTSMHADIIVPTLEGFTADPIGLKSWEERDSKVFWRGTTIGTYQSFGMPWRSSQRHRLVSLTCPRSDERRQVFYASKGDPTSYPFIQKFTGKAGDINAYYFDVAFEGEPIQCNRDDGTCDLVGSTYRFDKTDRKKRKILYKYVLDVDGNGYSTRFRKALLTGAVVFKATIYTEWITKRIIPWYHYVPVKQDYSDLHDIAAFFIGAPDGTGSHDGLAKQFTERAANFVAKHWRPEDIAAYQFRLFLEYARLFLQDKDNSYDFKM